MKSALGEIFAGLVLVLIGVLLSGCNDRHKPVVQVGHVTCFQAGAAILDLDVRLVDGWKYDLLGNELFLPKDGCAFRLRRVS